MNKNILIISKVFRPNIGGAETHINDLCEYLRKKGYFVNVITYQPLMTRAKASTVERHQNLTIIRIPWFGHNWYHRLEKCPAALFMYLFFGLFLVSFIFLVLNYKKIDVIHAQGYISGAVAKILKKIFRKRAVITLHALFDPIYDFKKRPLLKNVLKGILMHFDGIICLVKKSRDELINMGIPGKKIKICTHWIDLDRFKPFDKEICRKRLGLEKEFILLFVGRLIKVKGVELLLEVATKLRPKINFVFIGDGPLSDAIANKATNSSNIKFLGAVVNEDMPVYYNASDVLIIPSQYEELFGRVAIEALGCGLPVIASRRGSLPEIINSKVGILVEPSKEELLNAIDYVYDNSNALAGMRISCRDYAVDRFSENNAKVIEEVYNRN